MDSYKETFKTWNKIAWLYEDKFMDLDLYNDSYDFFCTKLTRKQAKVLEIGCGPGNITRYLLSKRPDLQLQGIDIAPNMIALAKKNNPKANFEVMDSRHIGKLGTKFDGIVCGFCLPYLAKADGEQLIRDAFDLLLDDGLLYLSFVEGEPRNSGFQLNSQGDRVYFYYHQLEQLRANLAAVGFNEMETFKIGYQKSEAQVEVHVILIAAKKIVV